MPNLRVMTFNVENLLMRFRFREFEKKSLATLLDIESEVERANLIRTYWNILSDESRMFKALSIRAGDPDVVCVQEVENLRTLRDFRDNYLHRVSKHEYRHMMLIEANDPRGIDVAVLSRFRIDSAATHQDVEGTIEYPDGPRQERIFRRDCLEVHVKKHNLVLPIFVCHFKSMYGGRAETRPVREAEARAVRMIIEDRFEDPSAADWLIAGDLNDYLEADGQPDPGHGLGPLLDDGFCVNLVSRIPEQVERWTHYYKTDSIYRQLDYLLASPALAARNPDVMPTIIRQGQPFRAERYDGRRWPRIGYDRPKASDHCPLVIDLEY